jgi:betaine reductase
MDLEDQWKIKRCAEQYGAENLVVVLGCPDAESAAIQAETVTIGDPSLAGPLTGKLLGLPVYHVMEEPIRRLIPPAVYQECIQDKAAGIDAEAIGQRMQEVRSRARELLAEIRSDWAWPGWSNGEKKGESCKNMM